MNRSTGVRTAAVALTAGRGGLRSGRKAQCFRSSSATIISERGFGPAEALASGHSAPASIHFFSTAIWSGDKRSPLPLGGIRSSSSIEETNWMSGLMDACPGTIACSPESALAKAPSRVSKRSPPFCFSGPWHLMQCASNSGRMSREKSGAAATDATSAVASESAGSQVAGDFGGDAITAAWGLGD